MFEQELADKFKRIFGLKKVTYDRPGETQEQECLFIEVETSNNSIKDGRAIGRVTGKATLFGPSDKIPFGFFSKRIRNADPDDTHDLFFSDFETNTRLYQNKVQRDFSFVYFFNSQYDPETGSIDEVTIDISEEL